MENPSIETDLTTYKTSPDLPSCLSTSFQKGNDLQGPDDNLSRICRGGININEAVHRWFTSDVIICLVLTKPSYLSHMSAAFALSCVCKFPRP